MTIARDLGLLVLRLAGLYLALGHGWGKIVGLSTGQSRFAEGVANLGFPLPVLFAWASALAECAGGIAVAAGFFTRWAAAFAAANMFVAAFMQHHALQRFFSWIGVAPATEDQLKAWGSPEMALLYFVIFVGVAFLGPGRMSVDARMLKKV
jgi:putative oxidoreductase